MKKSLSILLAVLTLLSVMSFGVTAFADKHPSGWFDEADGRHYYNEDGNNAYCEELGYIDGQYYYFNYQSVMQTGWIEANLTFYDSETGEPINKDVWLYGNSNGVLAQGWKQIKGVWYYFQIGYPYMFSDGIYEINGKHYLFKSSGAMVVGWGAVKGSNYEGYSWTEWYYADKNGALKGGWVKDGGKWYYMDKNYFYMYSNVAEKIDGKLYYFTSSGAMLDNGWGKDKWGDWRYATGSGALLTGWQKINNVWYYFDTSEGIMARGGRKIGNKLYIFENSGAWYEPKGTGWKSVTLSYFYDGKEHKYTDWFYIKNGKIATGWQKVGGRWYNLDPSTGAMLAGGAYKTNDDVVYFFENSGALKNKAGWAKEVYADGMVDWYYVYADGTCAKGWKQIGNYTYYFDPDWAYMYSSGQYIIDGSDYDFDANGHMISGPDPFAVG